MHPLLNSGFRLALYLGSWALVAILIAFVMSSSGPFDWPASLIVLAPPWLLYAFVCLSAWYVCRATPLEAGSSYRGLVSHLGSGVLAASLWLLIWELWARMLADSPAYGASLIETYRSQLPLIFAAGVLLFWLSGMFHYLLIAFETSRRAETRELGLEVMAREAELKALRAQIDPHFLFNSLNSISALTASDPVGARQMCLLLADFFRSSVRLGAQDEISLEEEIRMVHQYLEIEKVRFGHRLSTDVTIAETCQSCMIPPLILQPLIENSVRHGINSLVEGGVVKVRALCEDGNLDLSVENPTDTEAAASSGTGVGLANVRRRLDTRFGERTTTRLRKDPGLFRVEIRIPCDNGQHQPKA